MGRSFLYRGFQQRVPGRDTLHTRVAPAPTPSNGRQDQEDHRGTKSSAPRMETYRLPWELEAQEEAHNLWTVREARGVEPPYRHRSHANGVELRLLPLLHAMPGLTPLTGVVGMSAVGNPLTLNLENKATSNLLVFGPEGCGKSELLRALMLSLALTSRRSQVNFMGIDIGGREFAVLEALPHALTDLATEPGFAVDIVLWLREEIERRKNVGVTQPHLILFVDDMGWLVRSKDAEAIAALSAIVRLGQDVGVHLVAASRTSLPPALRRLLHHRGMVEAVAVREQSRSGSTVGRFRFTSGRDTSIADTTWMSARDLDTAVRLVKAGWRAAG